MKTSEGILLGYSESRKAYKVYNKRSQSIKESINLSSSEANIINSPKCSYESEFFVQEDSSKEDKERKDIESEEQAKEGSEANSSTQGDCNDLPTEWRFHKYHSKENLLLNPSEKVQTRSELRRMTGNVTFVS